MRLKRILLTTIASLAFATTAAAQGASPLKVVESVHHGEGIDHVFEFTVSNSGPRTIVARGRLVVINVYDASLPVTIPIRELAIPADGTAVLAVRWENAPLVGQVRALLVLNDGQRDSLVESFTFWFLPLFEAAAFLLVVLVAAVLALIAMRIPRYLKTRVPSDMIAYVVEFDDTVVSLSNRFDVSWQDIVRANRLKPPYELQPGRRVLIPKHGLRRPADLSKET